MRDNLLWWTLMGEVGVGLSWQEVRLVHVGACGAEVANLQGGMDRLKKENQDMLTREYFFPPPVFKFLYCGSGVTVTNMMSVIPRMTNLFRK